jgi:curved DNA-binding protein CbpA
LDYFKILGVSVNCSKEDVHKAFRTLSKQYHPDRFPESERADAEQRYQNIVKAFNTLKDANLREKYTASRFKSGGAGSSQRGNVTKPNSGASTPGGANATNEDPRAIGKRYFENGLKKAEANQVELAIESFKRSIYYFPTAEAYFHKGLVELKEKRYHREAIQSFQEAIKKSPKRVEYRLQLAKAFEGFGMKTRAASVIEQALVAFPENPKLLAMDEALNPEKYKKGGLGGLFGNILGKK